MNKKGLVYVFEGDGKGKTSAALGVAVRSLLNGDKVVWVSWFKSERWQISEAGLPKYFKDQLKMYWGGEGFFIKDGRPEKLSGRQVKVVTTGDAKAYDFTTPEEHKKAARTALLYAKKLLVESKPGLLVLDEVIRAIEDGLLSCKEVLGLISERGDTNLVLTGHVAPRSIVRVADLVTVMKKIKHPYDKGILAVKGLDY